MSRTTGKFKLVENGKVVADKISDDIIKYMEKIPVQVTIFYFLLIQIITTFNNSFSGWYLHPWLFLPQGAGQVHVHVRVSDGRAGVQQGAEQPGDGGHHLMPVCTFVQST